MKHKSINKPAQRFRDPQLQLGCGAWVGITAFSEQKATNKPKKTKYLQKLKIIFNAYTANKKHNFFECQVLITILVVDLLRNLLE